MSRYWTAQPTGSYQCGGSWNRVIQSQWEPTGHGPPITPGAPRSRFDLDEPPQRSVRPSQHAIALLRLPACDGRRYMAHAAWVKMLCTGIILPSVSPEGDQGSTAFAVRRGLAPLSVFALQSVPCICPPTSQPMADGLQGIHAECTYIVLSAWAGIASRSGGSGPYRTAST